MEQAIEPFTDIAPPRDAFDHALAVAGAVVAPLGTDQRPFALEIEEDFPKGYRAHLKFRETRGEGLLAFAALADVPVTRADTAFGVFLDAIARIEGIEVRGSAMVSPSQAARLEGQRAPLPEPPATVAPVALGASVLAMVPAVTPVPSLATDGLYTEDVARCVRCGCTEAAACEGGCHWVPNRQMVDLCSACTTAEELQAMTYTAEVSDGGE
ncbi:hypothetical protein AB0D59_01060 [Streptomyces sp. NPDC048417]|uniref:hypothetical protein n=1 Tax=Streptomyces sp. NPDC048417 TaxID=3155387 RepID=UPI00343A7BE5